MVRKDGRIQIYSKETKREPGTTVDKNYRHFMYSKKLYDSGGIYFSATAMSATDVVNSGLTIDKEPVKFRVNRNPKITNKMKVIFDGKVYDISYIDAYDFRSREMTFVAVESADTTKYSEDIFDD